MSTCLPFTGSSVWPLVIIAVAIATAGFALHRIAFRCRGSLFIALLVMVGAAGIALLAPRADAHASTCDPRAANVSITEAQINALPAVADAFVSGGVITPGQPLDLDLANLTPGETHDVYVASIPQLLGTGTVNALGRLIISVVIPSDLAPGNHTLFTIGRRSGSGLRQPVVLTDVAGTTATTNTTITPVTTAVPSTTTSTIAAPTTTSTIAAPTTTTTGPVLSQQTVSWEPETSFSASDSPIVLPALTSLEAWWASPSYSVTSTGTAHCSIDSGTRELTFTSAGTCTVQAVSPGAFQFADGVRTVTMTIGPAAVCDQSLSYSRGDVGPGGGVIVYASPTCRSWGRFLEVAPRDWSGSPDAVFTPKWCDHNGLIPGASGTRLGTGLANTYALITNCAETPALSAQAYRGGGKVDWYLPSRDEQVEICKWAHGIPQANNGCGGYSAIVNDLSWTDHYWTSTQVDANSAIENWLPGAQDFRTVPKDTNYIKVHPIRAFGLASSVQASWTSAASRTTARSVDFALTFSGSISGLTSSDLAYSGTATGCTLMPAASSGTSITVTAQCTSDGTISPILTAGSVSGATGAGPARDVPGPAVSMDTTAPSLTVSQATSTMVAGFPFAVSADEQGTAFLVNDSVTVSSINDITGAPDSKVNSSSIVAVSTSFPINSNGLDAGSYHLYVVDLAGNLSPRSASGYTIRSPQSCTTNCLVGDIGPGGGTVFYDAGSAQSWGRWLEAAPGSWHSGDSGYRPVWCDVWTNATGAMGTAIGDGYANTMAMLTGCTSGVAIDVQSYRGGGKVDWYLPSTDEMKMLCGWVKALPASIVNCQSQWGGGYVNNDGYTDHYWTSTQVDTSAAIETWMPGGNDYRTVGKDTGYVSARPIRAFGASLTHASITADQSRSTSRTLGFTVEFSGSATGLTSSDFDVVGTATGCMATPASSSGSSIHVTVVCASDGTVSLRIAAGSVSIDGSNGPSVAATSLMVPIDAVAPTLIVTNAPSVIVKGNAIEVAMSERGDIYIVNTTVTVTDRASITGAVDANWNSVYAADTSSLSLGTAGLADGSYRIYAIDAAGNVSLPDAATITVRSPQSCTTICAIGDTGPGGGTVFYDAGSVQSWGRYMEVATTTASPSTERPWCDVNTLITGADGTAIGTGRSNSLAIAGACTTAAAIDAMAYRGGGQTDWFLPSNDELRALCRWSRSQVGGSGCTSGWNWSFPPILAGTWHLWSSSQIDATNAWENWMPGTDDFRSVSKSGPGWGILVRPIRYF